MTNTPKTAQENALKSSDKSDETPNLNAPKSTKTQNSATPKKNASKATAAQNSAAPKNTAAQNSAPPENTARQSSDLPENTVPQDSVVQNAAVQNSAPPESTVLQDSASARTFLKSSTILIYKTLSERIIRRTHAYLQDSQEDVVWPTPADLIFNWQRKFATSTYNTVNLERSALMWYFESTKPDGWESGLASLKAHVPHRSEFTGNCDQVSNRKSRPPGRMIPENHLKELVQYLSKFSVTGMETPQQTQWFILAGIASGARPIEWCQQRLNIDTVFEHAATQY